MSDFEFKSYSAGELDKCGAAFVADLEQSRSVLASPDWAKSAKPWTALVLNWFGSAQEAGRLIDTSSLPLSGPERVFWDRVKSGLPSRFQERRGGTGEFLKLDLFVTSAPSYDEASYWSPAYWTSMLSGPSVQALFALESEWKGDRPSDRYVYVMHAAAKLAAVRANAKAIVFASHKTDDPLDSRMRWSEDLKTLRERTADVAPWLLIDVPWRDWTDPNPRPAWMVLGSSDLAGSWKLQRNG